MTANRWERLRAIYEEALALAPERRIEFIVNTCGDDTLLREQLLSLITAAGTDSFDDAPTRAGINVRALELAAGATVGRYTIVRLLGQGGMGAVYLAERADGEFHHRVAIKIVADGILSSRIMARLRSERQILAHLNHPNIANLFDGGATNEGVPYFAMEYVDGQRIDGYCRDRGLSIKDRLVLFRQVCAAVQYAHAQLIIHRDLKPSNILVTKEGVPKLLDFGIAKLIDPNSASRATDLTQMHERVLSPEYASPEQIRGEPVGTASDIYALGVLLYELLTQRRPHKFADKTIAEIEHEILEHTPLKPSAACLERSGSHDYAEWIKALRGDLDTIVMKALHIDVSERYASVAALSEDIENYLEKRPIKARPNRWAYRARKYWQRNRWSVASSLFAVGTIIALTLLYMSRLAAERDIANRERATAARVSEFMTEVFRVANPSKSRGNAVAAREVLDGAVQRIQRDLKDQPRVRIELMEKMAQAYVGIGLWTSAEKLLKSAVEQARPAYGAASMEFAEALTALAAVQHRLAHFEDERRSLETSLQIRRTANRRTERSSILTLIAWAENQSVRGKSDAGLATLGQAEKIAEQQHADSALMGEIYASYGRLYHDISRYREAERYLQLALPLLRGTINQGADRYADATLMLSQCMVGQGRNAEAIKFLHSTISDFEKIFGATHPIVGDAWNMLGIAHCDRGEYDPCSAAFQKSVDIERTQAPEGSRRQIMLFANLGSAYHDAGNLDAALKALDQAIELSHTYSRPHDLTLLSVYYEKAGALRELGRLHEAEAAIQQTAPILAEDPLDHDRASGFVNIERGRILYAKHEYAAAERQLRTALKSIAPEEPRSQANAHLALGRTLIALHRCDEGIAELRAAYDVRRRVMPKQNWFIYEAESALGDGMSRCAQFDAAGPLLENSVRELRHLRRADDLRLAEAERALAEHASRIAARKKN